MDQQPTTTYPSEADFAEFARDVMDGVFALLERKGREYGHTRPALSNFEEGAVALGMTPEAYLMAQDNKQHYVICQWATGRRAGMKLDSVQERIKDIIVYMLLLLFMIEQKETKK